MNADRGIPSILPGLLGALCLVLGLFASSGLARAAEPATITVYTALEAEQIGPLLEEFRRVQPQIEVSIVRDSTGVITARLLAEADQPRADVVWQVAVTSLMLAKDRGLLQPYSPAELSSIEPRFRDPADPPAWVGTDAWMTAFACNTVELAKLGIPAPRSFADLLDPRLKGLIIMPNPASSGTGFLTVSGVLQLMGEEKGWAYLDQLHQNIARYEHSGSKPAKLAASGECAVGISFCYASLQQKAKGAPLEVTFPVEGSGWEMEACALVRKPEGSPAARAFLDWATGRSAIEQYAKAYAVLARPDVSSDRAGYPADINAQMIENDLSWAAANRQRILDEWNRRYGS